ncbi:hypothetical protein CIG75_11445 [Tumebacillus algifaecis]|uniref:Uncharacterized protein n=1 Tax=Tumebacillus algifaecis TaxID=1214604 RepID=A0A223D1K4_9BACL|nr:hypothetical protein [Tumebacillus algifaecis]ASS75538.1 hypothetical protein CIG75_11445 [Tumebacillus algifaecis]
MLQYRLDVDTNRIYGERAEEILSSQHTHSLERLLPLTKPGFTVLIDLSKLNPEHLTLLTDNHPILLDYGVKRCAYLSSDYGTLGVLMKELRKRVAPPVERGYFTRRHDALRFLIEEKVEYAQ